MSKEENDLDIAGCVEYYREYDIGKTLAITLIAIVVIIGYLFIQYLEVVYEQ